MTTALEANVRALTNVEHRELVDWLKTESLAANTTEGAFLTLGLARLLWIADNANHAESPASQLADLGVVGAETTKAVRDMLLEAAAAKDAVEQHAPAVVLRQLVTELDGARLDHNVATT